jgi:ABC-type taurine transport system substrate-binding protein
MADSDKVAEKSLADINNVNALGASNAQAGTIFRYYDTSTGAPDATGDALFTATKTKGTTVYVYERESGKVATAAWATGDIALGMQTLTDEVQKPADTGGYIKRRVPMEPQTVYGLVTVA